MQMVSSDSRSDHRPRHFLSALELALEVSDICEKWLIFL
jgi:hypothetical protein